MKPVNESPNPAEQSSLDTDETQAPGLIRKLLPFVVLLLCIWIAYWITQSQPPASRGFAKLASPIVVDVEVLERVDFQQSFDSFGTVQAKQHIELFPSVSGRVVRVFSGFESGRAFKRGQTLLQIDPSDYEVALQVALGELAQAELLLAEEEARAAQAERDWKMQQRTNSAATITDFALRKPQIKAAKAGLKAAEANVSLARLNLQRTKVVAPFDGRIDKTFVGEGSVVSSATVLASLFDTSVLEVRLPVASDELIYLDLSALTGVDTSENSSTKTEATMTQKVEFENALVQPVDKWEGRLVRSEASIDAGSQQLYLIAQITQAQSSAQKQALKIGQYLKATISGGYLEQVIVVPNQAIYQGAYVYLVRKSDEGVDVLERRDIEVRWRNAEFSVIAAGLSAGERMVITPLGQVTSGTRVQANEQ